MQDYFAMFGIEAAFEIDEAGLKKRFYALSRELHPDQSASADDDDVIKASAELNKGYEVLRHFDSRVQHWLELRRAMPAEGTHRMPADFLAQMMDFNEAIDELQEAYDPEVYQNLRAEALRMQAEWKREFLSNVSGNQGDIEFIETAARNYFFQNRYLLRILENLDKFADS